MRVLPANDYRVEPWSNGGGFTRVIAAGRHRACRNVDPGRCPWDWRLSLAEIARAGPFSALPGVARQLMLVEGGPLLLRVDGRATRLDGIGDTLRFTGTDRVEADPGDSPVQVLNLMWRAACLEGRLEPIDLARWTPIARETASPSRLIYLIDALPAWFDAPVAAGDTVRLPNRSSLPDQAPAARGILATLDATTQPG
ncbi:MAG: HutD family protein [Xanthomonadales bacterium]|nr:HutD family protein [Xanthomonadales bacterium]